MAVRLPYPYFYLTYSHVESGTEATSTGGGAWSGWSTCPWRYSAVGLRYMELMGSVVDADVSSLDGLECIDDKCRAKSPRKAVKIRAACVKHIGVQMGTTREKTGTGWSSYSTCPSGYNPIGVAKAYMNGGWDTMRIWDCSTSQNGCRIYCVGTDKCTINTACISAKTWARAECSQDHKNLIVKSSTGTGNRQPSSCPSTHNSVRCICHSATQNKCSASRRRNVGTLSGCSHNFGSATGRVTRLCTQAEASIRYYLGDQASHIIDDVTAAYTTQTHKFTADGSGKLPLRVRGLSRSGVTLHVTDLKIEDSTTSTSDQSLLIDLENKCSGSRWEVQLPASPEGTPYLVTVTYGDKRTAIQTSSCSVGTAG
ncbi:nipblb, partial [Symbiodinium microadriaticum]